MRVASSEVDLSSRVRHIGTMRAFVCLTLALSAPPAIQAADPLTQGERDFAMSQLHASRKLFLDSVAGLSKTQWNWKPSPDRWSAAQCAEHIAVSEEFIMDRVKKGLDMPPAPDKRIPAAEARAKDEQLVKNVTDRSRKADAPEPLKPTNRFKKPEDAVRFFKTRRDGNIDYVMTTDASLRDRFMPHPLLGSLDLYQWLLLIAAHSERHTLQILELKTAPGFPSR